MKDFSTKYIANSMSENPHAVRYIRDIKSSFQILAINRNLIVVWDIDQNGEISHSTNARPSVNHENTII